VFLKGVSISGPILTRLWCVQTRSNEMSRFRCLLREVVFFISERSERKDSFVVDGKR
jgi:hypothetical protein